MRVMCRDETGLSMVEALVAMAILAIVSAPILSAFMVARAAQAEATGRTIAQSLARATLEQTQQDAFSNFDNVAEGTTVDTTTDPGYTITKTVTCNRTYNNTAVTPNVTICVLKTVDVAVTWTGAKQRQLNHRIATRLERRL